MALGMNNLSGALTPIRALRGKLDVLIKGRLWAQALFGLTTGVLVGFALGPDANLVGRETAAFVTDWLALPGNIFLQLIGMIVTLLVAISILRGLGAAPSPERLRSVGLKLAVFIVLTTGLGAAIGVSGGLLIKPGSYVELPQSSQSKSAEVEIAVPAEEPDRSIPELVGRLIPQNPEAAFVQREMLPIVIFAIIFGIALAQTPRDQAKPLLDVCDSVLGVCMTIVKWAMFLAPWAVFGLLAQMASQVGLSTLVGMAVYIGTVLGGLVLMLGVYYLIVMVLRGINPVSFQRRIGALQLLAFSTSSSAAVMPLSIETAEQQLGTDRSLAELLIPLGATVNMAGTALYQSVAVVFLAQASGVDLSFSQLIFLIITIVGSSIGTPGTPGVGIVILGTILADFGVPTAGLVLVFGVDRILDMARTVVNVTGDVTACAIFGAADEDVPPTAHEAAAEAA